MVHLLFILSVPDVPVNPRCYVEHHTDMTSSEKVIEVEFRWNVPEHQNGEIKHYIVSYSINSDQGPWLGDKRVKSKLYFHVNPALRDTVYHFRVSIGGDYPNLRLKINISVYIQCVHSELVSS